MKNRPFGRVEDYTPATLVMILINLIWIFAVIWWAFGFITVAVIAIALNHGITWVETRKLRREAVFARFDRPKGSDGPLSRE